MCPLPHLGIARGLQVNKEGWVAAAKEIGMINCRNCINWVDESLVQIELDRREEPHIFMGCRIFGYVENNTALESCPHYIASENLFTLCATCHLDGTEGLHLAGRMRKLHRHRSLLRRSLHRR